MAASVQGMEAAAAVSQQSSSQRRVNWPDVTTAALIRIWEDQLPALRGNTRNARIYAAMAAELNAGLAPGEGRYTAKQVKQKMDNLNKKYRQLRRTGTATGSPGVPWQFYWQLHSFLGSLPINDDGRVEESLELPVINEVPGTAEVLASGEDEPLGDRADPQLLSMSPLAVLPILLLAIKLLAMSD
ncbi:myb/SANT-like DNA-binding domain-containing protein 1 [Amblyomma americanum]